MVFLHLLARGWENFRFLGYLMSFLGEGKGWRGARPFTFIEPAMMNHLNSNLVDGKIICFMCVC